MKSLFNFIILLLIAVLSAKLFAAASADKTYMVDLSQSDNLKAFFDAGLRPWRLPGLENSDCILQNDNLRIILPGSISFNLQTELVNISVLAGNQLDRLDITCASKPFHDAANDIRKICQDLQISTNGLDDFAAGKRGIAWGGIKTINEIFVQVRLQSEPSLSGPMAMLAATIVWHHPDATMKFLTSPIQPPPGYENVSMDPPPRDPNRKQLPEHDTTYYQNQVKQIVQQIAAAEASGTKPNSQAPVATTPTQTPLPAPIPPITRANATPAQMPTSWFSPWIGLLAILLIIAAIYALKKK
jgi:hypothetical protein